MNKCICCCKQPHQHQHHVIMTRHHTVCSLSLHHRIFLLFVRADAAADAVIVGCSISLKVMLMPLAIAAAEPNTSPILAIAIFRVSQGGHCRAVRYILHA